MKLLKIPLGNTYPVQHHIFYIDDDFFEYFYQDPENTDAFLKKLCYFLVVNHHTNQPVTAYLNRLFPTFAAPPVPQLSIAMYFPGDPTFHDYVREGFHKQILDRKIESGISIEEIHDKPETVFKDHIEVITAVKKFCADALKNRTAQFQEGKINPPLYTAPALPTEPAKYSTESHALMVKRHLIRAAYTAAIAIYNQFLPRKKIGPDDRKKFINAFNIIFGGILEATPDGRIPPLEKIYLRCANKSIEEIANSVNELLMNADTKAHAAGALKEIPGAYSAFIPDGHKSSNWATEAKRMDLIISKEKGEEKHSPILQREKRDVLAKAQHAGGLAGINLEQIEVELKKRVHMRREKLAQLDEALRKIEKCRADALERLGSIPWLRSQTNVDELYKLHKLDEQARQIDQMRKELIQYSGDNQIESEMKSLRQSLLSLHEKEISLRSAIVLGLLNAAKKYFAKVVEEIKDKRREDQDKKIREFNEKFAPVAAMRVANILQAGSPFELIDNTRDIAQLSLSELEEVISCVNPQKKGIMQRCDTSNAGMSRSLTAVVDELNALNDPDNPYRSGLTPSYGKGPLVNIDSSQRLFSISAHARRILESSVEEQLQRVRQINENMKGTERVSDGQIQALRKSIDGDIEKMSAEIETRIKNAREREAKLEALKGAYQQLVARAQAQQDAISNAEARFKLGMEHLGKEMKTMDDVTQQNFPTLALKDKFSSELKSAVRSSGTISEKIASEQNSLLHTTAANTSIEALNDMEKTLRANALELDRTSQENEKKIQALIETFDFYTQTISRCDQLNNRNKKLINFLTPALSALKDSVAEMKGIVIDSSGESFYRYPDFRFKTGRDADQTLAAVADELNGLFDEFEAATNKYASEQQRLARIFAPESIPLTANKKQEAEEIHQGMAKSMEQIEELSAQIHLKRASIIDQSRIMKRREAETAIISLANLCVEILHGHIADWSDKVAFKVLRGGEKLTTIDGRELRVPKGIKNMYEDYRLVVRDLPDNRINEIGPAMELLAKLKRSAGEAHARSGKKFMFTVRDPLTAQFYSILRNYNPDGNRDYQQNMNIALSQFIRQHFERRRPGKIP